MHKEKIVAIVSLSVGTAAAMLYIWLLNNASSINFNINHYVIGALVCWAVGGTIAGMMVNDMIGEK